MLIWSEKFRKVMPPLIKSRSEAINTLGGSPMAVAAPPILEKITIAINTGTKIEKVYLNTYNHISKVDINISFTKIGTIF